MNRRPSFLVAVLAAACALSLSGSARADDLADEADLRFQLGAEAYQQGNFKEALQHFLASNRLVPNKNVVFNIARAYEQLRQYPGSVSLLRHRPGSTRRTRGRASASSMR